MAIPVELQTFAPGTGTAWSSAGVGTWPEASLYLCQQFALQCNAFGIPNFVCQLDAVAQTYLVSGTVPIIWTLDDNKDPIAVPQRISGGYDTTFPGGGDLIGGYSELLLWRLANVMYGITFEPGDGKIVTTVNLARNINSANFTIVQDIVPTYDVPTDSWIVTAKSNGWAA